MAVRIFICKGCGAKNREAMLAYIELQEEAKISREAFEEADNYGAKLEEEIEELRNGI